MSRAGRPAGADPVVLPGPGDRLAEEAAAVIRERSQVVPRFVAILGSGLGGAAGELVPDAEFAFEGVPGFPPPAVPGHPGRLVLGSWKGVPAAAFRGRIHFYEGHPMTLCALPVRVARLLGAHTIVVTAACGALDPALSEGDVIVAADHINMMGANPLRGWRLPDGTPAFVELGEVYDHELAELARREGASMGIRSEAGVYAAVSGPSYETPAEIELMRRAGASVVGMSVVPEVLPARALDLRVLGLFVVGNVIDGPKLDHLDVLRVAESTADRLGRLLSALAPHLGERSDRSRAVEREP